MTDNRPKCISYSLFGYGKSQYDNCFNFASYIRGLYLNIRLARLIYPEWEIVLQTDTDTYNQFKDLFENTPGLKVQVNPSEQLCKMMLWRLKPIFEQTWNESVRGYTGWKYSHVICRDLDSPLTYRERQAVQYWIDRDKAMHAITDSVSHTVYLMGGMIGAKPDYFTERVGQSFDHMMSLNPMDFSRKGSDQDFLNSAIYPKFAQKGNDSITQHYFLGMPNTFLTDYKTCACPSILGHEPRCVNDYEVPLHHDLKESNSVCGHIGASGYYSSIYPFLNKYNDQFTDLYEIESKYPDMFHWIKDGTFKKTE